MTGITRSISLLMLSAGLGIAALFAAGIPVQAAEPGRSTDPSSPASLHSNAEGETPGLPPHVPPHGREPREQEEEAGASTASLNSYLYYSASHGWTQTSPKIYVLFWGDWTTRGDPYNVQNYLYRFYSGIGGSGWNRTQTQYGYNCGTNAVGCSNGVRIQNNAIPVKYAYDSTFLPTNPTEAQMQAAAQRAANYWGDRSVNAQYIIAMSTGHRDQKSIANSWCAWHNYTWSNGNPISYTSLPYIPDMGTACGAYKVNGVLDGVSIYAGHEFAESETDPFLNAWGDPDTNEDADKCLQYSLAGYFRNYTFSTGTFVVQPLWSNWAYQQTGSGCVFWS